MLSALLLPLVAALSAVFRVCVKPKLDLAGYLRTVPPHNNARCSALPGLESCEDLFLDQATGWAYLTCSLPLHRAFWTPALRLLQRNKIPFPSQDYVAILNLHTLEHRRIELVGVPPHILRNGIHAHGIDLYVHPSTDQNQISHGLPDYPSQDDPARPRPATIYLVNHNPPPDVESATKHGAHSVIEVFDTVLGHSKATHRTTVSHELMVTPSNLLGLDEHSFYVTNDHAHKMNWKRSFEPFLTDSEYDSIIFCDLKHTPPCRVAAHGDYPHSKSIAKGPGDSVYMVNTFDPKLRVFEIQADHSLVLTDELKLPRMCSNLYVTPSGAIFLATIPAFFKFKKVMYHYPTDPTLKSPTEVWKISNGTGEDAFFGGRLQVEKVLGDDGFKISATTAVAVWRSKLVLTGSMSPWLSICEIAQ